jgi:TRAP-type C4-dicarboxylate transport system substrate-binding protein
MWYGTLSILEREMNKLNLHLLPGIRPNEKYLMLLVEPVDSVMDLEKRIMRSYSKPNATIQEAMNGVPVNIAWGEAYTAIERGTAEGLVSGWGPMYYNKFHEVAPYAYDIYYQSNLQYITINKEMWEALPEDVQHIVNEELNRAGALNLSRQALIHTELAGMMLASGLKNFDAGPPPPEFFELMTEKVTTPLLAEALEQLGPLGEEFWEATEKALGREIG